MTPTCFWQQPGLQQLIADEFDGADACTSIDADDLAISALMKTPEKKK